jgi:hypothetical protein
VTRQIFIYLPYPTAKDSMCFQSKMLQAHSTAGGYLLAARSLGGVGCCWKLYFDFDRRNIALSALLSHCVPDHFRRLLNGKRRYDCHSYHSS